MFILTELIAPESERPFVSIIGTYNTVTDARREMRSLYSYEVRRAVEDGWIDDVLHGKYGSRKDYLGIDGNTARVFTDYRHFELNIFDNRTNKLAKE